MTLVQYDLREGIGYVTLNQPEKRNALNAELVQPLIATQVSAAQHAQAIEPRGNGRNFCATPV